MKTLWIRACRIERGIIIRSVVELCATFILDNMFVTLSFIYNMLYSVSWLVSHSHSELWFALAQLFWWRVRSNTMIGYSVPLKSGECFALLCTSQTIHHNRVVLTGQRNRWIPKLIFAFLALCRMELGERFEEVERGIGRGRGVSTWVRDQREQGEGFRSVHSPFHLTLIFNAIPLDPPYPLDLDIPLAIMLYETFHFLCDSYFWCVSSIINEGIVRQKGKQESDKSLETLSGDRGIDMWVHSLFHST